MTSGNDAFSMLWKYNVQEKRRGITMVTSLWDLESVLFNDAVIAKTLAKFGDGAMVEWY